MKSRIILITGLLLCLVGGIARSDESASARLVEELQSIDQLTGSFEQQQYSGDSNELVATSTGRFRLLRPGYFSWEILTPDSQLIIANPDHVWHHDRDLETVTRRPVDTQQNASPLQVLGGNMQALNENYAVEITSPGHYLLRPLLSDPGFKSLTLIIADGMLSGMQVRDNLDQRLEITFSDIDSSPGLTPGDFDFVPPEGADLFYHEQ